MSVIKLDSIIAIRDRILVSFFRKPLSASSRLATAIAVCLVISSLFMILALLIIIKLCGLRFINSVYIGSEGIVDNFVVLIFAAIVLKHFRQSSAQSLILAKASRFLLERLSMRGLIKSPPTKKIIGNTINPMITIASTLESLYHIRKRDDCLKKDLTV